MHLVRFFLVKGSLFGLWMILMITSGCANRKVIEISFETNGGTPVEDIFAYSDASFLDVPTPSKMGHSFEGWFLDPDLMYPLNEKEFGKKSMTLYAKWTVNQYTVFFQSNGGSEVEPITAFFDDPIVAPENPVKANADFGGWYFDVDFKAPFTFYKMGSGNITLYARWIPNSHNL